jgi:hypothetical protein
MAPALPVQPNKFHAERLVQATQYLILPHLHPHPCLIFPYVHTLLTFLLANGKQNNTVMLTRDREWHEKCGLIAFLILMISGLSLITALILAFGSIMTRMTSFLSLFHMEVQYGHGWVTWK